MTLQHQDLVELVGQRAALDDAEQIGTVVTSSLEAVASRLDDAGRSHLAQALPPLDRNSVQWDRARAGPSSVTDEKGLINDVARATDRPPEQARTCVEAVLATLVESQPRLGDTLREQLGEQVEALFHSPAQKAREEESAAAADQPRALTFDEIARALEALPEWVGETHQLSRSISIPSDRVRPLLNAVQRAERELDHRAGVEQTSDGLTFTLRTRSVDGVTERDLRLARGIEAALIQVSSGG